MLRLQQILLYRELGMPLDDIKSIMGRWSFDVLSALESHKEKLKNRVGQMQRLINTVDDTILYLKGKRDMRAKQLFEPFNETQQAEYENEAMQMYDIKVVKASNRKWKSYTKEEKQCIGEEGNAAYLAIVAAIPSGPESYEAQAGVEQWRTHKEHFWSPVPTSCLDWPSCITKIHASKPTLTRWTPAWWHFCLEQ